MAEQKTTGQRHPTLGLTGLPVTALAAAGPFLGRTRQRLGRKLLSVLILCAACTRISWGQTAAAPTVSNADNAWMLLSAALVLLMTGPGLALFYGGLVRKKNVLSTLMQSFAMMAIISMVWAF